MESTDKPVPPTPEIEPVKTAVEAVVAAGPFDWRNFWPTLLMALVAGIGGFVSWYSKIRAGASRPFNIIELIGEIVVSSFAGLVMFWVCRSFHVNEWATAAGVAITGHMGARAIFLFERMIERKMEEMTGVKRHD